MLRGMPRVLALLMFAAPLAAAADGSGALKPPAGYPAFLPFVAGGKHDPALSNEKTTVLRYAEADASVAKKMRAMLTKEGFTFEEDEIPGMSGQRFVARKAAHSAYFTIKPEAGSKTKAQMLITDTSGLPSK